MIFDNGPSPLLQWLVLLPMMVGAYRTLGRCCHRTELGVHDHQRVAAQSRQVVNLAQQQPVKAFRAVAYGR
jgi:hypothetical protein